MIEESISYRLLELVAAADWRGFTSGDVIVLRGLLYGGYIIYSPNIAGKRRLSLSSTGKRYFADFGSRWHRIGERP